MGEHVIEFDCECESCKGTGLYVGMAEREGSAVVCHTCKGTGKTRSSEIDKRDDWGGKHLRHRFTGRCGAGYTVHLGVCTER